MHTGSQVVLDRLWSLEELRGSEADARIHRLASPDTTAPRPPSIQTVQAPLGWEARATIRRAVPRGSANVLALTFDLCETENEVAGYDAAVVNYLRDAHVPATFFAGGKWMRSHPEKTKQLMADPLFEVGSHGWSHRNLRQATDQLLEQEVLWPQWEYGRLREELAQRATQAGVSAAEIARIPSAPRLFRFPFGACNDAALAAVANAGLHAIQWSIVTGDPAPGQTAPAIVRTVLGEALPGSIVIFHANGRGHGTTEALRELVPVLRDKGYTFVTVSELLDRSDDWETTEQCYELRPGDNLRYDHALRAAHAGSGGSGRAAAQRAHAAGPGPD
jgi:peptidoglycan/xylan/chitin deacetylase (PgdA/CDA1 family)